MTSFCTPDLDLLTYWHRAEDQEGDRMELRFVRDAQRRNLDFVVVRNGKPMFAVECKTLAETN